MTARRLLIASLAAVVLLVAGLALASCGEESDIDVTITTLTTTATIPPATTDTTTTTTTTIEPPPGPVVVRVTVVNGAPKGGIVRKTVQKGDRVVLVVVSDVADHVHLHGYDITRSVAAGRTLRIRFKATVPGRFEVELEDRGAQIADLTVRP